jgi:translation initiation factor RLI1
LDLSNINDTELLKKALRVAVQALDNCNSNNCGPICKSTCANRKSLAEINKILGVSDEQV